MPDSQHKTSDHWSLLAWLTVLPLSIALLCVEARTSYSTNVGPPLLAVGIVCAVWSYRRYPAIRRISFLAGLLLFGFAMHGVVAILMFLRDWTWSPNAPHQATVVTLAVIVALVSALFAWLGIRLVRRSVPFTSWGFVLAWSAFVGLELGLSNSSRLLFPNPQTTGRSYKG